MLITPPKEVSPFGSAAVVCVSCVCVLCVVYSLNDEGCSLGMASGGAEHAGIILIISRMSCQLCDCAARTEKGTATIFTSIATFFGTGVPSTGILSSLAQCIQGPHGEEDGPNRLQDRNKGGDGIHIVWLAVDFKGGAVDDITQDNDGNNLERKLGGDERTRFTQPCEL